MNKKGEIKKISVSITLDEQDTRTFLEFYRREGFDTYAAACRALINYSLQEQPKHFPKGLWGQVMYEARKWAFDETGRFLADLQKQMMLAAERQNPSAVEEEGAIE